MAIKLRKLQDQVIVITGASSGIGLTTAEMAAERGARVVLNARNEMELRKIVDRIQEKGGRAAYVVGDVADDEVMDLLAQRATDAFGRIDTWVNNAGIGMYGKVTEQSTADKRRLFDVNFWGVVSGCRAAVRHMAAQGGAIINIGSIESDRAVPLHAIYAASKHAIKGYTDALRMELEQDGVPISVTLIKPGATNTPFIAHARNYMEEEPEFPPPVYAPETVARAILHCAEKPMRDITVGGAGRMITMLGNVAPRFTDTYMNRMLAKQQKSDRPDDGVDSLYGSQSDGTRRGPTKRMTLQRSAYTRAAMSDAARFLPLLAVGALVFATVRMNRGDASASPQ